MINLRGSSASERERAERLRRLAYYPCFTEDYIVMVSQQFADRWTEEDLFDTNHALNADRIEKETNNRNV